MRSSLVAIFALSFSFSLSAQTVEEPVKPNELRYGVGVGISTGAELEFEKWTSGGVSGEATIDYNDALTLAVEARYMPAHSLGAIGGVMYDFERSLSGGTISSGGVTATFSASSPSKIQITTLHASGVYKWEQFYIPIGFNYSIVKFTPAPGASGSADEDGGLGYQIGVGFEVNRNFAVEALARSLRVDLTTTTSTGTVTTFDEGYLRSWQLIAKYFF